MEASTPGIVDVYCWILLLIEIIVFQKNLPILTSVSGYTPGQTINVNVDIKNESSSRVYDLEVKLNKVRNFLLILYYKSIQTND